MSSKDGCFLSVKKFKLLTSDCYIDYEERPHVIAKSKVEKNADIEPLGELDEKTLKEIYNGIIKSSKYSPVIRLDIYNSFDRDGITDLKKPVSKRTNIKLRKKKKSN
jgi:hypothetical protein